MKTAFPRTAVLRQLSRIAKSQAHPEQKIPVRPAFATRGLELIRNQLHADEKVEVVFEGLEREVGADLSTFSRNAYLDNLTASAIASSLILPRHSSMIVSQARPSAT